MIKNLSFKDSEKIKQTLLKYREILDSGCWKWLGPVNERGRGRIKIDGRKEYVHRISLLLFGKENFETWKQACHRCNFALCFNPEHLYWGTQSENTIDSVNAGTHNNASMTHCKNGHEFNLENTRLNNGRRVCKICANANYKINRISKLIQNIN